MKHHHKPGHYLPDDFDFNEVDMPYIPTAVAAIPALPYVYDENDSRCVDILNKVAEFCGKEFTEIPPDPDGTVNPNYDPNDPDNPENPPMEGGDIMPLDDDIPVGDGGDEGEETDDTDKPKPKPGDPDFVIDPDDPDKEGQIDPDIPGELYPDGTGEDPNPDLDDLRDAYKKAKEQNLEEKRTYWAHIWQAIRFISNVTCWTENATDTFIVQVREQHFDTKQIYACGRGCCNCDEDKLVIPLDYLPLYFQTEKAEPHYYNPERDFAFVGGKISAVVHGKPLSVNIPYKYLNDHYDPTTGKIYILRDDFPQILLAHGGRNCCLCLHDVVVTLIYNAGYETIPDALLTLICPLLARIDDSKLSTNDCAMAMTQVSGLLKSKKIGNIQYTWSDKDTEAAKTQSLYTELFNIANLAELNALSRCSMVVTEDAGDVI